MDVALVLILPVIGGYYFASYWNFTKFRCAREDGHRLYFRAALYGTILFLIAYLLREQKKVKKKGDRFIFGFCKACGSGGRSEPQRCFGFVKPPVDAAPASQPDSGLSLASCLSPSGVV